MTSDVPEIDRTELMGSTQTGRGSLAARSEKMVLLVVLLVVGGALGYAAIRGGIATPAAQPHVEGDIALVSRGEAVDLTAHLVPAKYTIYDFYADWCPPCRTLDARLHELASEHDDLAIRKIDIVDWSTPVVEQQGIDGLPHMVLFDPNGKQLASGQDVFPLLNQLFDASF